MTRHMFRAMASKPVKKSIKLSREKGALTQTHVTSEFVSSDTLLVHFFS